MYLFGEYFARRASGTFVMPNTLGVFAACVVALAAGFGSTAKVRALAWTLGVLVVLASGSATGLVMLGAVGVAQALWRRRPARTPGLLAPDWSFSVALLAPRPPRRPTSFRAAPRMKTLFHAPQRRSLRPADQPRDEPPHNSSSLVTCPSSAEGAESLCRLILQTVS
jgi:hypothetical protein